MTTEIVESDKPVIVGIDFGASPVAVISGTVIKEPLKVVRNIDRDDDLLEGLKDYVARVEELKEKPRQAILITHTADGRVQIEYHGSKLRRMEIVGLLELAKSIYVDDNY